MQMVWGGSSHGAMSELWLCHCHGRAVSGPWQWPGHRAVAGPWPGHGWATDGPWPRHGLARVRTRPSFAKSYLPGFTSSSSLRRWAARRLCDNSGRGNGERPVCWPSTVLHGAVCDILAGTHLCRPARARGEAYHRGPRDELRCQIFGRQRQTHDWSLGGPN